MVAGSLAAGVGYGLFLLLAAEVLVTFSLLRIFLFLSGAMLLGSVITFFCEGLVGLQAQAMLVLLPLLATLCLQGAYEHVPAADRPKRGVPKFSYPWKLFVLYGLYAFAYGMRANQLVAGAGRHSSASTFILMAVLFATAYFASKRFNIGLLYRSPVVLMVCGFLLVPAESLFGTAASSYLIAISYSLMSFLVMFLLFDIAKRLGVAIVAFMAIKNAEQLLQLAGGGATDALGMLGLPASTEALAVTVIVSVLILAATVLLFSEKELASKWGVSILEEGGLVQRTAEEERAAERVEELSYLPPESAGAGGAGASGRGQDRPGRPAGAVHRRGHLQGPHPPHLREDGHQLPQGAVRAAGPSFVSNCRLLLIELRRLPLAGLRRLPLARVFWRGEKNPLTRAGFALE